MDKQEVKKNLLELLTSKDTMSLQIDETDLKEETSLINDIGLDSIQILELIVAIENKFKFSIDTDEINIEIFDRFADLVDFIEENVKK
ncbi:MAG: acyl carrier protein [bacterium]|nr:acyl carrier protein [bacterium]